jgi:DEPDC5-like protein
VVSALSLEVSESLGAGGSTDSISGPVALGSPAILTPDVKLVGPDGEDTEVAFSGNAIAGPAGVELSEERRTPTSDTELPPWPVLAFLASRVPGVEVPVDPSPPRTVSTTCVFPTAKSNGRLQWVNLSHDDEYTPGVAFQLELQWLVATGRVVDAFMQTLIRNAKRYGFLLIQAPLDVDLRANPFLNPIFIPLRATAATELESEGRSEAESVPELLSSVDPAAHLAEPVPLSRIGRHVVVLQNLGFVPRTRLGMQALLGASLPNMTVLPNQLAFVHPTGCAVVRVVNTGFVWTPNGQLSGTPSTPHLAALRALAAGD